MRNYTTFLFSVLAVIILFVRCQKDEPIPYVPPVVIDPLAFTDVEKNLIMESDTDMRVLTVLQYADSLQLRNKCRNVKADSTDQTLQRLIDRMYNTMIKCGTVGIAAPQIGIERNVIWVKRMDKTDKPFECYLNVKIEMYSSNEITFAKDSTVCVPGQVGKTKRSSAVSVSYNLLDGSFHEELIEGHLYVPTATPNFTAVLFQQMVDHLNGVLWIDKEVP